VASHDLVIRGGTVIDGSGADRRTADVAISDGIVTEVGRVTGTATRECDADGALVIPGFVDIHTHYDGQAVWDDHLAPSSWHGVTTAVFGNCGVGFAPVHDFDHDRLVQLMEGVEDIPGTALHEGLPWTWNSFAEYLDALDTPKDVDFAAQVPHGALRLNVMGERGAAREDATDADIEAMGELAAEGIEAGALGFTTSRTSNHRTSSGDFTPTLTAAAEELIGIAEAVGRTGKGVFQLVSDFVDRDLEFAMLRDMCEASGRPLSFTLVESPRLGDFHTDLLARIESARADGLRITGQVPVGDRPCYEPDPSESVARRAARMGIDPAELALDLLCEAGGTNVLWVPFSNYGHGNLDTTRDLLTHPHTVPALSDGGAHVGTICDGSFPTTLLQHWGRDRPDGRIELEFLVQRQCRDTAAAVGLEDRGVLAPGMRADVNVIDLDRLAVHRPEAVYDLPAGGRRLLQRADGYLHTFVAGTETYCGGEATGELPGRLVRGAQPAAA